MQKEIKYICYYDLQQFNIEKRNYCLAATNKIDYICTVLAVLGHSVQIISSSSTNIRKNCHFPGRTTIVNKNKAVTLGPTFSGSNRFIRLCTILYSMIWLTCWLLLHCKKDETVMVYHSPMLCIPVLFLKKLIGCKIILEVEEVYHDAQKLPGLIISFEKKMFSLADAFLFSTELLPERLNINRSIQPYEFIYGIYKTIPRITEQVQDGKIHLVYAGIIDKVKLGAFNALDSAKYLDNKYVMHIIGFGKSEDISELQDLCNSINKDGNGCKVVYDGKKSDDDYVNYMQRCHIGLSTQAMSGKFLQSSFPSKILSYLSLGLRVVSCDAECVRKSKIGSIVTYYSSDNPSDIAEAIKSIDINDGFNALEQMNLLHKTFLMNLKNLIND